MLLLWVVLLLSNTITIAINRKNLQRATTCIDPRSLIIIKKNIISVYRIFSRKRRYPYQIVASLPISHAQHTVQHLDNT